MELRDYKKGEILVAISSTNPEYNSIFELKESNYLKNRLYINKPIFEKECTSQFSDDCIRSYKWEFKIATPQEKAHLLACIKANKYVEPTIVNEELNLQLW